MQPSHILRPFLPSTWPGPQPLALPQSAAEVQLAARCRQLEGQLQQVHGEMEELLSRTAGMRVRPGPAGSFEVLLYMALAATMPAP